MIHRLDSTMLRAVKSRGSKIVRDVLIIAVITFALAEITLRALTGTAQGNFMPALGKFALLPYRPPADKLAAWYTQSQSSKYIVQDLELGWTIAKNGGATNPDGSRYESNAQGARAAKDRVYADTVPPDTARIVAVGDSFTHCDGVELAESWEDILEKSRKDLEVVNLGIPGAGSDQALLRYRRDGAPLHPDIAILGLMPENLLRNMSITRYYFDPSGIFFFKPRFVVENGAAKLVGSPVPSNETQVKLLSEPESAPEIIRLDHSYVPGDVEPKVLYVSRVFQAYATYQSYARRKKDREDIISGRNPEGIELATAIAKQFKADAEATGALPLVVLMPLRPLIEDKAYDSKTSLLVTSLEKAGLTILDPTAAIRKAVAAGGPDAVFQSGGRLHLSANGNKVLAQEVEVQLRPHLEKVLAKKKQPPPQP